MVAPASCRSPVIWWPLEFSFQTISSFAFPSLLSWPPPSLNETQHDLHDRELFSTCAVPVVKLEIKHLRRDIYPILMDKAFHQSTQYQAKNIAAAQ
jgi:hypothetical protein